MNGRCASRTGEELISVGGDDKWILGVELIDGDDGAHAHHSFLKGTEGALHKFITRSCVPHQEPPAAAAGTRPM